MNPLLRRLAEHTEVRAGTIERLRAHFAPPSVAPTLRALGDIDEAATIDHLRSGRRRPIQPRLPRIVAGSLLVVGAAAAGSMSWMSTLQPDSVDQILLDDRRSVVGAPDDRPGRGADLPSGVERREPARGALADVTSPVAAVRTENVGMTKIDRSEPPPPGRDAPPDTRPVGAPSETPPLVVDTTSSGADVGDSSAFSVVGGLQPLAPSIASPSAEGTLTTLAWEVGTFEGFVVAPDVLIVTTREARIRVTEGAVAVQRDRRGTSVAAPSGRAHVRCGSLAERPVPVEGTFCLPVSAAGWLGRGQALRDAGAPNAEVLTAADAGLTFGADDPAFGELIVLRVACLRVAGRHAEARAAARMYPKDGPRAAELEY